MMTMNNDTVIVVTNYGMGKAEEKLQLMLMQKYLSLLLEQSELPYAICFYTEGVRLTVDGSSVLDQLQTLEARGMRLIICSTCLNYFGLQDKVRVGIVGGMPDILEAQIKAAKVFSV
jgi:intracellular sulfur oxidation DsrE/DsrF family protein